MRLLTLVLFFCGYVGATCQLDGLKFIEGAVTKIVDGDTVYISGTPKPVKIRLLGIDAPESNFQGQSQGLSATEATARLKDILPLNSKVKVYYEKQKLDVYGRLLGHVVSSGVNINEILVKEGLAVSYFIFPNVNLLDCYQGYTEEAMAAKLGMFGEDSVELPFEFRDRVGKTKPDRWVGNISTKALVKPLDYKQVPVYERLFFDKKEDAIQNGFVE